MNTKFDAPHSRFSEISREQFDQAGMITLVESTGAGVYMAVSPDGFKQVCLQGHPEYDTLILLNEYKRDVNWYGDGTIKVYPLQPKHYFEEVAQPLLDQLKTDLENGTQIEFPEKELELMVENTWADSARAFLASWIGHVYQTTNIDRTKQYMDGVNPLNPLDWKRN